MKKILITGLLASVMLSMILPVVFGAAPKPSREDARRIIGRTAAVILTAQQVATQGEKNKGLGLSVSHQVYAVGLFRQGLYSEAVFHSLRARVLAAQVIKQLKDALYDRMEEKYVQESPAASELDQKVRESNTGIISDQEALNTSLPLDAN